MRHNTLEILTGLVLCGLGLLLVGDALRLGNGWAADGPQAGFYPFYVGLLLAVASGVIVVQHWRARAASEQPFVEPGRLRPVLAMLLPVTLYVAALYLVGLYVASALFLAGFMLWQGRLSWWRVLPVAVGVPVLVYAVFERWFQVALPKGPLEAWLGL